MARHLRLFRVIYVTILISILASLLAILWQNLFLPPRTIVIQANPVRGEQGLPGRNGTNGKDAYIHYDDGNRLSINIFICPNNRILWLEGYLDNGKGC